MSKGKGERVEVSEARCEEKDRTKNREEGKLEDERLYNKEKS